MFDNKDDIIPIMAFSANEQTKAFRIEEAQHNYANALASNVDPAKASASLARARDLGVDKATLETLSPDEFYQREKAAIDWARMDYEAPKLSEMMRDQGYAEVIHGDVTSLWSLEGWKQTLTWKAFGDAELNTREAGVGNAISRGINIAAGSGPISPATSLFSSTQAITDLDRKKARLEAGEDPNEVLETDEMDGETAKRLFLGGYEKRREHLMGQVQEEAELFSLYHSRLKVFTESEAGLAFAKANGLGEAMQAYLSNPSLIVEQGLQSAAMMAPQLAALPFTGPMAGAAIMGGSSFGQESNSYLLEGLSTQVNLSDPNATTRFLLDPNNADYLTKLKQEANAKGAVVGAFDAVSVGIAKPLSGALSKLMTSKSTGATVIKALTEIEAQAGLGAAGEAFGQVAAKGEVTSWKDVLAEAVGEHFTGPLEILGATHEVRMEQLRQRQVATANTQALARIASGMATVQNPDPLVIEKLFAHDEESQKLYLDQEALKQSAPEAYELISQNPEMKARMEEASTQGKDTEMTLAEYAQYVAMADGGTGRVAEHIGVGDVLAQSKVDEGLSEAEKEAKRQAQEALREEARLRREAHREEIKGIRQEIEDELSKLDAGKMPIGRDERRGISALWGSLISTLALDTGVSARDIWEENKVHFSSQAIANMPDARGAYVDGMRTIYRMPETADQSTLLHETGHAYLDLRQRALAHVYAKQAMGQELTEGEKYQLERNDELLKWLGFDRASWTNATADQRREAHEKWAESFEQYLKTGQAPVRSLQRVFNNFRKWLMRIYTGLTGKRVQWSPAVQQLFNSMFLTSQMAQEFRIKNSVFFDASQITRDTTDAQMVDSISAIDDEAAILAEVEDELHSVYERLAAGFNRERRKAWGKAKEQALAIFKETNAYKAIQAFRGKTEGFKLNPHKEVLKAIGLTDEQVKRLIDSRIGRVKTSPNTINDEATFEAVAQGMGYESPRAMMDDVLANLNQEEAVERIAHEIWNAKRTDEKIEEQLRTQGLDDAVFAKGLVRQSRGIFKAYERFIGTVKESSADVIGAAARAWAGTTPLKKHNLKDVARLARENTRRARNAYLKGELKEAVSYQKKALYYMKLGEAVKEARADAKRVARIIRTARKLEQPTMSGQHLELLHRVLAAMGVGDLKRYKLAPSDKPISEHLKDLSYHFPESFLAKLDSVERQVKAGLPTGMTKVEDEEAPVETIADALELDTPDGIRHLGDLLGMIREQGIAYKNYLKELDKEFNQSVQETLIDEIMEAATARDKQPLNEFEDSKLSSRIKKQIRVFWNAHLRAHTLFRRMSDKADSAFNSLVIYPTDVCATKEEELRGSITEKLDKIFRPIDKRMREKSKVQVSGSESRGNGLFTFSEIVIMALNLGNEGNMKRMAQTWAFRTTQAFDAEKWTTHVDQMREFIGEVLTVDDLMRVQAVWDVFDGVHKKTDVVAKRMDKKSPEWIQPAKIKFVVGGNEVELQGGYYPIRYDRDASRQNVSADINEAIEGVSVFGKNGVSEGHLKSRVDNIPPDMFLTLTDRALFEGLDEQIHFIAFAELVKRLSRLFDPQGSLSGTIHTYWGRDAVEAINKWLLSVALGNKTLNKDNNGLTVMARFLRQGVSVAGIGFNVVTALVQPVGYTQTVARLGGKYALIGLSRYLSMGGIGAHKFVQKQSAMMRNRAKTQFRELREVHSHLEGATSSWRTKLSEWAYMPVSFAQSIVDVPTWIGAYEKAIADGNTEANAILYADRTVIETQGSGRIYDLSAAENGQEWQKLMTVFYTFFNTALNLASLNAYQRWHKDKVGLVRDLFMVLVLQSVIESFLREGLKDVAGSGGDDKEPWYKRAASPAHLAKTVTQFNLGLLAGIREFQGALDDYGYKGAGGYRKINDLYTLFDKSGNIVQGDIDVGTVRAMIRVFGVLAGVPTVPIDRAISGYNALKDGKTNSLFAPVLGYTAH